MAVTTAPQMAGLKGAITTKTGQIPEVEVAATSVTTLRRIAIETPQRSPRMPPLTSTPPKVATRATGGGTQEVRKAAALLHPHNSPGATLPPIPPRQTGAATNPRAPRTIRSPITIVATHQSPRIKATSLSQVAAAAITCRSRRRRAWCHLAVGRYRPRPGKVAAMVAMGVSEAAATIITTIRTRSHQRTIGEDVVAALEAVEAEIMSHGSSSGARARRHRHGTPAKTTSGTSSSKVSLAGNRSTSRNETTSEVTSASLKASKSLKLILCHF